MEKLISVIVPVYNVEKYLNRCVESIVNQTYKNLEIILVDDGSPDQCPLMCDDWAKKDSRIQVIHKDNGGLSDARNAGMKIATGDYIAFVDSDDWISVHMYEVMIGHLEKTNADICECQYRKVEKKEIEDLTDSSEVILNQEDALEKLLIEDVAPVVWNKVYRIIIVQDLLFKVGKYNEDEFWTYLALDRAKKIVQIDSVLYNYYYREDSIIHETYSIKRLAGLEARYERMKYLKKYPRLQKIAKKNLIFECMFHYQKVLKYLSGDEKNKAKNEIKTIVQDINITKQEMKKFRRKEKVWYYLSKISFHGVCKLRNQLGYGI